MVFFFLNVNITFPIALFIIISRFSSFYLGVTVFGNSNSLAASGRTYSSFSEPNLGLTASPTSTEHSPGGTKTDITESTGGIREYG